MNIKDDIEKEIEYMKLKDENRFYDISNEHSFRFNEKKAMNFESKMETGKKFNKKLFNLRDFLVYSDKKRKLEKLKKSFIESTTKVGIIIYTSVYITSCFSRLEITGDKNYKETEKLVKEYDANLKEYASKFNTDNMSSIDIIMTVMNDIRSNTYYGYPEENISYDYPRLTLNEYNNIGVCRHMADKFTTIMNLIDPRFEAKNLAVTIDSECDNFEFPDIERPISKEYLEMLKSSDERNVEEETFLEKLGNKIFANHLVTILKPIEDDCYLVVDVTNPSIGVLDDMKIYTFNAEQYEFLEYSPATQVLAYNDTFETVNKEVLSSMVEDIDIEELDNKYGLEAQNKVLKKIKE